MATLRTLVGTATLTLALASSCNKKTDEGTNAPVAAPAAAPTQHDEAPSTSVVGEPVPAAEKINIVASVDNLEDMFEAFKQFGESFDPDSPSDPLATLQSQLLAFGFGPGFLGNIDLGGTHVLVGSFPAQGQGGPTDSDFAASIAVKSGRKVLESTPSAFRPQPLGEGMWEFSQDSLRMLIKEAGKELQLGMTVTDLDRAAKLQGEVGNGRRVRLRATNIPADDIDPAGLLNLPDIKIVRDLTKVVQEVEALEIQSQIGTKNDFEFIASAEAPFHKLGLGPLGKPQTSSSPVEKVLPAGPVFVTSLAYGNPKALHAMIDSSVPKGMIPDSFKAMAEQTLGGVHGILDQIGTGVVFALYVDAKGQGTLVAAADVKDEAAANKSLRSLNEVMVMAVDMQKAIGGKDKTRAFDASFKRESVKLAGGAKGDRLSIKVPKGFAADVGAAATMFVKKGSLHVTTLVQGGVAVVAIGSGGRDVVAKVATGIAKPPRTSLAQDVGLKSIRAAMGGCQLCVSGGANEYLRFRLLLTRDGAENKAASMAAATWLRALSKIADLGAMGAGVKVEKNSASFGAVLPQSLLYADRKKVEQLLSMSEFVADPEAGSKSSR